MPDCHEMVALVEVMFETAMEEIAKVLLLTAAAEAVTGTLANPEMEDVWVEVAMMVALPDAGALAGAV
jgi:hypothetical protein